MSRQGAVDSPRMRAVEYHLHGDLQYGCRASCLCTSQYGCKISCLRTLRACCERLGRCKTTYLPILASFVSSTVTISVPDMCASLPETDKVGLAHTKSPLSFMSPAAPLTLEGSSAGVDAALAG